MAGGVGVSPWMLPMEEIVKDVWYAGQNRALSPLKFITHDSKGTFVFRDHDIVFKGSGIEIIIDKDCTLYMGYQRFKWLRWLIVLAISIPIYGVVYWTMSII